MFANCKVYMNAGHCSKTTDRHWFIPVNDITSKIGQDVSICLPASLATSGCDTTSSLFKIGKRTAYNTLVVNIADAVFLSSGHQEPNLWIHEEFVTSSNTLVLSAVTSDALFRSRIVRHWLKSLYIHFDGG